MGWRTFSTTEETALPKSKVKMMLILLFDSQGFVHKVFVQEGCTVNAEYYKGVLHRLISRIRRFRPDLYRTREFFLLHDKATAHSAATTLSLNFGSKYS
jgi:hypothetical protein